MTITFYKDLSDAKEIIQIESGIEIKAAMPQVDFTDKIIIVNGLKQKPEYVTKNTDVIIIRTIAQGPALVPILWIVGGLAVSGIIGYAVATVGNLVINVLKTRKQVAELENQIKLQTRDEVSNIPTLQGASNSIAKGKTQPYLIGQNLFTPYKLITGYRSIWGTLGSDESYFIVLQAGFNRQVLRKVYCDDVKIKTWSDAETSPQEGLFTFDTDSPFYSLFSLGEVAQDGNPFATAAFNKKIVSQQVNDQLKKSGESGYQDLIYTLEKNTKSADICIMFNGLRAYLNDGTKVTRTVTVIPSYKYPGGAWTDFTFPGGNLFSNNIASQIRFVAHLDFTYATIKDFSEPILIKLRCATAAYDGSAMDDCYVQWVQSYIYNPDASKTAGAFVDEKIIDTPEAALSTLIGLSIHTSLSNQDKLSKINIRSSGIARTWTGSAWTTSRIPTSNPASWLLEVLTSSTHKPSQCADSEIDLESFGELYEYCETNSLHCNTVLIDGDTKESVLSMILDTCNATLYQNIYGKMAVAIDAPKENAIAVINTQNCLSFSNKKEMGRISDGIKINYVNKDEDYYSDTYLVMRDGVTRTSTSIIREMTVTGIEEYSHVVKYARRILAIEQLRPKMTTVRMGRESIYFTPLSKVLVQHPSLKIGLGSAEIKSVIDDGTNIIGLELYEPIEYDSTDLDGFGVVIQSVDEDNCTELAKAYTADTNGRVTEITLTVPIALTATIIPHQGDILSYGYLNSGAFDTITSPMLLVSMEPDDSGYALKLVDYNESIYETGTIPEYTPNITSRKTPFSTPTELPPASKDELAEAIVIVNEGTEASIPNNVTSVSAVASQDSIRFIAEWYGSGISNSLTGFIFSVSKNGGGAWTDYSSTSNTFDLPFNRDVDGYPSVSTLSTWRVRVKAINSYGYVSAEYSPSESGQAINTDTYVGWTPGTPSINTRVSGRGISIGWANASTWYGMGDAQLQIAKGYTVAAGAPVLITNLATLVAYPPATTLNPRLSYDNYREGAIDGTLSRGGSVFTVAVPLYGQHEANSAVFDTPYYVRARMTTKVPTTASPGALLTGTWTAWTLVYGQGTTAQEVVANAIQNAHIVDDAVTANKIAVEFLSAINANLGVITDGAMVGNENNMWAVSRIYEEDGITVKYYEGTMRVGGTDQYLHITPVVVNGVVTDYNIDFRVGNFTVTAVGSTINGVFEIRNISDNVVYFSVDPSKYGVTKIRNTLEIGSPTTASSRETIKEGYAIYDLDFTGTGNNDMEIVEDGTVAASLEVKITEVSAEAILPNLNPKILSHDYLGNIWACDIGTTTGKIYKCPVGSTTFTQVTAINALWFCIHADKNGNIWAGIDGGGIYKCPVGSTTFTQVTAINAQWRSIASDKDGNIWACASNGKIYKCNAGTIIFNVTTSVNNLWSSIDTDPFGNIFASAVSSYIYKCPVGSTTFTQVTAPINNWSAIKSDKDGNIWATDQGSGSGGGIYKCPVGSTTFTQVTAPNLMWRYLTSDIDGNIWASYHDNSNNGGVYECQFGSTAFMPMPFENIGWNSITFNIDGNIWAGDNVGHVYKKGELFSWRVAAGTWSTKLIINPATQYILTGYGSKIQFSYRFGHVLNDLWTFSQGLLGGLSVQDSTGHEYFIAKDGRVGIECENYRDVSTSVTLDIKDTNILVTTANAITITIPAGMKVFKKIKILRSVASEAAITIARAGAETIEGGTSFVSYSNEIILTKLSSTNYEVSNVEDTQNEIVITGSVTLNPHTSRVIVNTANAVTITIPENLRLFREIVIERIVLSTNGITVARSGSTETIEGATTYISYGNTIRLLKATTTAIEVANFDEYENEMVITASATINARTKRVIVNTANAVTITIPSGMRLFHKLQIERIVASTNAVTLARSGTETIEGATTFITHGATVASVLNTQIIVMTKTGALAWTWTTGEVYAEPSSVMKIWRNQNGNHRMELTGTTGPGVTSSVTITHGLNSTKIKNISGMFLFEGTTPMLFGMMWTDNSGIVNVLLYVNATNVTVTNGGSSISGCYNKPFVVVLEYTD